MRAITLLVPWMMKVLLFARTKDCFRKQDDQLTMTERDEGGQNVLPCKVLKGQQNLSVALN